MTKAKQLFKAYTKQTILEQKISESLWCKLNLGQPKNLSRVGHHFFDSCLGKGLKSRDGI